MVVSWWTPHNYMLHSGVVGFEECVRSCSGVCSNCVEDSQSYTCVKLLCFCPQATCSLQTSQPELRTFRSSRNARLKASLVRTYNYFKVNKLIINKQFLKPRIGEQGGGDFPF